MLFPDRVIDDLQRKRFEIHGRSGSQHFIGGRKLMSENRKRPTIERDVMNRKNKPMMRVRDLCDVESAYRPALEIEQRETALARQLGDPCFAIGSGAKIGRSDLNVFRRRKNLLPWLAIFRWIDCPKHFVAIDERKERPAKRVEI